MPCYLPVLYHAKSVRLFSKLCVWNTKLSTSWFTQNLNSHADSYTVIVMQAGNGISQYLWHDRYLWCTFLLLELSKWTQSKKEWEGWGKLIAKGVFCREKQKNRTGRVSKFEYTYTHTHTLTPNRLSAHVLRWGSNKERDKDNTSKVKKMLQYKQKHSNVEAH